MSEDLFSYGTEEGKILVESDGTIYAPEDALTLCMRKHGIPVIPYLKSLTNIASTDELVERLNLYQNPASYDFHHDEDADYLTAKLYLNAGGNPYKLLKIAKEMHKKYGRFQRNIDFLKKNLPEKVLLAERYITPGAKTPAYFKAEFLAELLHMDILPEVKYDTWKNKWTVKILSPPDRNLNHHEYGTENVSAVENFTEMMNLSECKKKIPKSEILLNQDNKVKLLQKYQEFLFADPDRVERIQDVISAAEGGYISASYDVYQEHYPGMNPELKLYKHQHRGVSGIKISNSRILIMDGGAGKTYTMVTGAMELKRLGLAKKILFVIPNDRLDSFVEDHRYAYPNAKLLVIYPKDFYKKHRAEVLKKIKEEEYDGIYMAYSSYDELTMSKEYYIKEKQNEINKYKNMLAHVYSAKEKTSLKKRIEDTQKELVSLQLSVTSEETACFDQLGIDAIFVDECHNYKNITIETRMEHVVGLNRTGSSQCNHHKEKVHYILRKGGKVVFASATPIKGSLADQYAMMVYLQPDDLEFLGIYTFDDWANTFCSTEECFEIAPNGQDFRKITRLKFHNLTDLMNIFSSVAEFYKSDKTLLDLPDQEYINVVVPRTKAQEEVYLEIARKMEDVQNGVLSVFEYNALLATLEGKNCALDIRLVNPAIVPEPGTTKAHYCAREVVKIYHLYPDTAQVIFCDTSIPKDGFNVYDEVKKELVTMGIPEHEIAFIHDGKNTKTRRKLLNDLNEAKIRIMIGSTRKLGTGVNIQKKLIAQHHLDVPWSPADREQRDWRGFRQGNDNAVNMSFSYIGENSYDAYAYQIMENKQKIIKAYNSGILAQMYKEVDDVAGSWLNLGEIKALAIGNPLIRTRVEIENELQRLKMTELQYKKELYYLQNLACELPLKIHNQEIVLKNVMSDIQICQENKGTSFIDKRIKDLTEQKEKMERNLISDRKQFQYAKEAIAKGNPYSEQVETLTKKLEEIDQQLNEMNVEE